LIFDSLSAISKSSYQPQEHLNPDALSNDEKTVAGLVSVSDKQGKRSLHFAMVRL